MTKPRPETIEREKDKLYVTDAELYRRLGLPREVAKPVIEHLEAKGGFPQKQKLWGGRRYWPAVKAYLDRMNGLTMDAPSRRNVHG